MCNFVQQGFNFSKFSKALLSSRTSNFMSVVKAQEQKNSFRFEFTPVQSCGSVFAYMISAQNLIPERVIPVRVHPGNCT